MNQCRIRNITLEGKIIIFKTLTLSKIVHLTLNQLIEEMQKIQKAFIWNNLTPEFKHATLRNSFEEAAIKNVDINSKIANFQCPWIKRLYDDKFHEWKLIPLRLIKSTHGINFKFHSNLDFGDSKILKQFSKTGTSTFHLLFYHNQFGITKTLQQKVTYQHLEFIFNGKTYTHFCVKSL